MSINKAPINNFIGYHTKCNKYLHLCFGPKIKSIIDPVQKAHDRVYIIFVIYTQLTNFFQTKERQITFSQSKMHIIHSANMILLQIDYVNLR